MADRFKQPLNHTGPGKRPLGFDRRRLRSVHPGETAASIRAQTGFDYDEPASVPASPVPDAALRDEIRDIVRTEVAETYPRFAEEFSL